MKNAIFAALFALLFTVTGRADSWGPGQGSEGVYGPGSSGGGTSLPWTTSGDTLYYDGAAGAALAKGTSGQFLRQGASYPAWVTADTSMVAESGNLYSTNARVLAYVLTAYSSGAGTVSASDTILQAFQKLNGNQVLSKATADAALPSASFTAAAVTGKLITGYVSGAGTVAATDTILEAIQKLNGNTAAKASLTSPQFETSVNLNYSTASTPLVTDSSKNVVSQSYVSFLASLVLTGYTSGSGTVASTDNVLQAIQKLNGNDALKLPLAGGTVTGGIISTSGTSAMALKCTNNDTKPCIGNASDPNQGFWMYNAVNMRLVYSSNSFLDVGGQGVTVNGKIHQYDKILTATMPVTGLNRNATVTAAGNTAATPTDVFSKTLEASNWVTAKTGYTYEVMGTFANTVSVDKSVKLVLGSTTLFDSGALTGITSTGSWIMKTKCSYRDSTHAVCGTIFSTNLTTISKVTIANETLANALTIKTTINGTNANDVQLEDGWLLYNNESWN